MEEGLGLDFDDNAASGLGVMDKGKSKLSDTYSVRLCLADIVNSKRSFYPLADIAERWGCPIIGLLDLGSQGKLRLSVAATKWRIHSSSALASIVPVADGIRDRVSSCHVHLATSSIFELISIGEASIEDLWVFPGDFAKVIVDEGKPFPTVQTEDVHITRSNAIDYLKLRLEDLQPSISAPLRTQDTDSSSDYLPRTTDQIADIFKLDKDPETNRTKWRNWAHHAKRNRLFVAREAIEKHQGRKKKQSRFFPDKVGKWLVEEMDISPEYVQRVLDKLIE